MTIAGVAAVMEPIGRAAVEAAHVLALTGRAQKDKALTAAAAALVRRRGEVLAANARDMKAAGAAGLSGAMLDRLELDDARVEAMAGGLLQIAALPDPVGTVIAEWQRPNGLRIQRVRVPLGVIGIIYESRPNVTCDAGALCLKSGNAAAAILRGGSESHHSSAAIRDCLVEGLRTAGLPEACIQLVPTTDRAAVGYMLSAMGDYIDVIVPRGGKSLVARVQQEARVPVIGHLEGNCHVYVDRGADLDMARAIVRNAKLRRTGICGAAETLLVDEGCAATHLAPIVRDLLDAGCEVGAWTRPSGTSRAMALRTRSRSSRRIRPPPRSSSRASTARSCSTTPRRSSPTAASSAWVPRSASRPTASTPAARWASSS